ncbi:MAG: hypothetical protein C0404_03930 [Verrucomicrobia bacterium]|nr:hypothetical protein [Verrucomicrobiota bacterium]
MDSPAYKRKAGIEWRLPAIIVGFAALVHLLFVAETQIPEFNNPVVDAYAYHAQAIGIVNGNVPNVPFWQPPLFPYWLSLVYRVIGPDPAAARYFQVVWTVMASLLVFIISRRLLSRGLSFVAALLVPIYGPMLFLFGQLMPTGMAVALDLLVLLVLMSFVKRPNVWRALAVGALLGVAALAVPNILVLLPVAVAYPVIRGFRNKSWREPLLLIFGLCAGLMAVLTPVTLRNARACGELIPISTNGGINLFIGNNADSDRTMAVRPGPEWDRLIYMPLETGSATSASGAERFFTKQVLDYALQNPARFAGNLARKAWHFLSSREIPRNVDVYVFRQYSVFLQATVWKIGSFGFPFALLLPLSIIGLLYGIPSSGEKRVLVWFVLLYSASVILFIPASRYKLPAIAPLLIFAVAGLAWLFRRTGHARKQLVCALCIGACVTVVVSLPAVFPMDRINLASELQNDIGMSLFHKGDPLGATARYLQAIRLNPSNDMAYCNLGNLMTVEGDVNKAEDNYNQSLRIRPDNDEALLGLGRLYCIKRQFIGAAGYFRAVLDLKPDDPAAMKDLGFALLQAGRPAEAAACFQKALKIDGLEAHMLVNLGGVFLMQNSTNQALRCLRKAAALDPSNPIPRQAVERILQETAATNTMPASGTP